MKLGLLTAAFSGLSLERVAPWAASEGFEALEVACWPSAGGEGRRYAGVSHIAVERLDPDEVLGVFDRYSLAISALAYYPNNLHPDDAHRAEVHGHLRKVVDAAQGLGVGLVCTFVGNDKDRPLPENLRRFREIWPPLVDYAGERGVRIAIRLEGAVSEGMAADRRSSLNQWLKACCRPAVPRPSPARRPRRTSHRRDAPDRVRHGPRSPKHP